MGARLTKFPVHCTGHLCAFMQPTEHAQLQALEGMHAHTNMEYGMRVFHAKEAMSFDHLHAHAQVSTDRVVAEGEC